MKGAVLAVIGVGIVLSGCATIIKGTTQSISVTSTPTDGADCTLQNTEGTWFLKTPGSVVVHKTKNDLDVSCKKVGFNDGKRTIVPKFGAATFGNVIAGGLIGVGVDAASGANYEYPATIDVPMTAVAPVAATPPVPATPPVQTSKAAASS